MKINNNTIEIYEDSMYINGVTSTFNDISELYIFLENILTNYFNDIYLLNIDNKLISRIDYKKYIAEMFYTKYIKYIFLLDIDDNIIYYVDVSDDKKISTFTDEIVNLIF